MITEFIQPVNRQLKQNSRGNQIPRLFRNVVSLLIHVSEIVPYYLISQYSLLVRLRPQLNRLRNM